MNEIDSPEWKRFVAKVEAQGWKWIDPRSGSAYQWRNPAGIYVLEGPLYVSHAEARAKREAQREIDRANRPPVDPAEKQRLIDLRPKLTPGNKAAFDIISNDYL